MDTNTFKVYYFSFNGRAALIRAILSCGGVQFENHLIDKAKDWPTIKKSGLCEFEQVPVLVHGDKKFAQSAAIYLYLAKYFKFYGNNIDEQYQIDSLIASIDDVTPHLYPLLYPKNDEEKNNKPKYEKIYKEFLEFLLKIFEERYKKLGFGNYFLGDHFSLADIFFGVQMMGFVAAVKEDIMSTCAPNLKKLVERLKQKELKEFYEKYLLPQ